MHIEGIETTGILRLKTKDAAGKSYECHCADYGTRRNEKLEEIWQGIVDPPRTCHCYCWTELAKHLEEHWKDILPHTFIGGLLNSSLTICGVPEGKIGDVFLREIISSVVEGTPLWDRKTSKAPVLAETKYIFDLPSSLSPWYPSVVLREIGQDCASVVDADCCGATISSALATTLTDVQTGLPWRLTQLARCLINYAPMVMVLDWDGAELEKYVSFSDRCKAIRFLKKVADAVKSAVLIVTRMKSAVSIDKVSIENQIIPAMRMDHSGAILGVANTRILLRQLGSNAILNVYHRNEMNWEMRLRVRKGKLIPMKETVL